MLTRQGSLVNLPKPPFSLGFEAAGFVEAVGENVDFKVSDAESIEVLRCRGSPFAGDSFWCFD